MRVLIVRVGAMGDVLHALPAVAALRRAEPTIEIGWAIDSRWAPLLESGPPTESAAAESTLPRSASSPLIDRLHLVPTRAWKRSPLGLATAQSILDLRQNLRAANYTIAVDLQGTIRSAVIGSLAAAPLFLGRAEPRERLARLLYRQLMYTPGTHVVAQAADLLRGLTSDPLDPIRFPLPRDVAAEIWAQQQLAGVTGPVVFLAPTAGWGAKMWPAERFGALARALDSNGVTVLVNAAGAEDRTAQAVVAASAAAARSIPCTLPQMIALLRRTSLVVAGDTGPLHLGAALGCPVVGLYGPTDPARTGPWGTQSRVLRDPRSVTDHSRSAAPEAGLLRIGVDDVLGAALEMLDLHAVTGTDGAQQAGAPDDLASHARVRRPRT